MKKFRNKNSRDIVKRVNDVYYMTADEIGVPKRFIENSCDWEEVKEKNFEIISFSYDEVWGEVKIHSVKRLSDGEIFTLGDKAKEKKYGKVDIINSLDITEGGSYIYAGTKNFSWGQFIENIEIVKPFYTTYDGVDVEKNTELFWVIEDVYKYSLPLCALHLPLLKDSDVYKVFYRRGAAEAYVIENTPLFKSEDGVKMFCGSTYWCVNTAPHLWSLFEQTAKERTILNKSVLAFSTKELAEAYLLMNKPLLSLNDLLSVWDTRKDDEFYSTYPLFKKFKELVESKLNEKS